MHAAEIPFGGGVSPRNTRCLRGQSTIEYVLIIAIIVLVVLIVGPWVSSEIRNQFNTVTETIDEGTSGNAFKDPVDIPDPKRGTAFAVYSADDHSLMFYKRRGVPQVGNMFNDRRVTEVYTGFETASYGPSWSDTGNYIPWSAVADEVLSAKVIDCGIAPVSIAHWFDYFHNMRVCDLEKLIARDIESMDGTFFEDIALSSLVLPASNFDSLCDTNCAFSICSSLTDLDIGGFNIAHVVRAGDTFSYCLKLHLDCSDWSVAPDAQHSDFNTNAPGVILPKAWQ